MVLLEIISLGHDVFAETLDAMFSFSGAAREERYYNTGKDGVYQPLTSTHSALKSGPCFLKSRWRPCAANKKWKTHWTFAE